MLKKSLDRVYNPLHTMCAALLIIFFSCIALLINHFVTHYPGNNYFPAHIIVISEILLLLLYTGCTLQFGKNSRIAHAVLDINWLYLSMAIVILATNAAQYTPFKPIDTILVQWNGPSAFWQALIRWIQHHPMFHQTLEWIYDSLTYEMIIIPLVLIFCRQTELIQEYTFLFLANAWLGFTLYYFFPTTAPASQWHDITFSHEQYATSLKFYQIHHFIAPTTSAGGLIAFPSFHVIWAWLCTYSTRKWPIIFFPLVFYNILITAACVLLGWHYFIDIVGSMLCLVLCKFVHRPYLIPWLNDNPQLPIAVEPGDAR